MPEDTLVEREDCPHGQRLILIKFVSYRKEDLCRGMADVVTSGAGDIYFRADSFRARSGKRNLGLGLGLGKSGRRKDGLRGVENSVGTRTVASMAPAERGPTEFTIQNQKLGSEAESGRWKREGGIGLRLGLRLGLGLGLVLAVSIVTGKQIGRAHV